MFAARSASCTRRQGCIRGPPSSPWQTNRVGGSGMLVLPVVDSRAAYPPALRSAGAARLCGESGRGLVDRALLEAEALFERAPHGARRRDPLQALALLHRQRGG